MSNNFITNIKTNLNGVLQNTQMFDGIMMTGDDSANEIIVEVHRDLVPYVIPSGTKIVGYFIRSDGVTLEVDGTVTEEGYASVVVPALAYQVSGNISIAIRMFLDPTVVTQRGYYAKVETGDFVLVESGVNYGPNGEEVVERTVTENETRRGYYVESVTKFVIVNDESVIEGPDGEEIVTKAYTENVIHTGYYDSVSGEFIIVDDESITEGPNGEEIVTEAIPEYVTKRGYYYVELNSEFIIVTDDSITEGPNGEEIINIIPR